MEAFREYLTRMWSNSYENINQVITHKNVNDKHDWMWAQEPGSASVTVLDLAVHDYDDVDVVCYLISIGACVTPQNIFKCHSKGVLTFLLDAGIDPHIGSLRFPNDCGSLDIFRVMADYGSKPCIGHKWDLLNIVHLTQIAYLQKVDRRVTACRRALVAMVGCCRQSEYTALRAVYKELAKWMWRMRGGGERCGPRGEKWGE